MLIVLAGLSVLGIGGYIVYKYRLRVCDKCPFSQILFYSPGVEYAAQVNEGN